MLSSQLIEQQLLPGARRRVRKEVHFLLFPLFLYVPQRVERLTYLISGMKQHAITVKYEMVVALDEVFQR